MPKLIDRLRDHCRTRPGMTLSEGDGFTILGGFLDEFVQFYPDDSPPVALLRVRNRVRKSLAKKYPGVRESDKMHWEMKGWAWTDVPLDGTVPEAELIRLIDRSYQLVLDEKGEETRSRI